MNIQPIKLKHFRSGTAINHGRFNTLQSQRLHEPSNRCRSAHNYTSGAQQSWGARCITRRTDMDVSTYIIALFHFFFVLVFVYIVQSTLQKIHTNIYVLLNFIGKWLITIYYHWKLQCICKSQTNWNAMQFWHDIAPYLP